jgi:hypothetical protein
LASDLASLHHSTPPLLWTPTTDPRTVVTVSTRLTSIGTQHDVSCRTPIGQEAHSTVQQYRTRSPFFVSLNLQPAGALLPVSRRASRPVQVLVPAQARSPVQVQAPARVALPVSRQVHSESPSQSPSASPSESPSESPSTSPSTYPSTSPSQSPSTSPSESPSSSPSQSPKPIVGITLYYVHTCPSRRASRPVQVLVPAQARSPVQVQAPAKVRVSRPVPARVRAQVSLPVQV